MDILTNPLTPADSTAILAANTAAVSRLDAVNGIHPLNATANTAAVDLTPLSSTTVDLSPLGQFLSSLSLSRKTLTQLQGGATADATAASDASHGVAVTAAAQQLANAFNALQTTAVQTSPVGAAQSAPDGLVDDNADNADTQLVPPQAQSALQSLRTPPPGLAAGSNLDALAQLGITLQTPASAATNVNANNNLLVVDELTLQAAFAANPAGTIKSLNQAAESLYAYGANALQQTSYAVAQANSLAALESESTQALQQPAAVSGTSPAANGHLFLPQPVAAIAQTTLADMALTDLLGETQQATNVLSTEQQLQAAALAASQTTQITGQTAAQATAQTAATQAAAAQAASVNAAAQTTEAATEQQQADAALASEQAASATAAAQQSNDAAAANSAAQTALQAQTIQQTGAAASNNAQTNAETGIEEANRLARDPAIAAAIAAYHLNDGPLHTDTAEKELGVLAQRQIVAPVAPVTRVEPAEKV